MMIATVIEYFHLLCPNWKRDLICFLARMVSPETRNVVYEGNSSIWELEIALLSRIATMDIMLRTKSQTIRKLNKKVIVRNRLKHTLKMITNNLRMGF